jgi:anti-sigma B factor antagonist
MMAPMTHDGFTRRASTVGEVHVVALQGELDMDTAAGLSAWLVEIAGSPVVVDLSELTFIDSSGIAALATAKKRMTAEGNEMILTRPRPNVRRVLEILGLVDWVADWDTKWDAP